MLNFLREIDTAVQQSNSLVELLYNCYRLWIQTKKTTKEVKTIGGHDCGA